MTSLIFIFLLKLFIFLVLAPLLPGLIVQVKSWVAGRKGPPVLQLYFDLAKLLRKGMVISDLASPAFVLLPVLGWGAVLLASLLLPMGPLTGEWGFHGDVILFIYLLGLARFCGAWSAMETGSSFEGMGTVRELSFSVLAEAAMITAVIALSLQSGSMRLDLMLMPNLSTGTFILAVGLFLILLVENCRVPFDDPNTHLELTMIHEVMVLDHSGPLLGIVLHGASMKLLLFALLLIQAVLPLSDLSPLWQMGALLLGVLSVMLAVGLVESLLARYAFKRVPILMVTAFLFCLFALLLSLKGGIA